jgi:hypothetical protein
VHVLRHREYRLSDSISLRLIYLLSCFKLSVVGRANSVQKGRLGKDFVVNSLVHFDKVIKV